MVVLKNSTTKPEVKGVTANVICAAMLGGEEYPASAIGIINLTFGQLIDKWEQEKPIPEPEEEFRDVDKIGLYIDVFFKGHLSKMMGLKNAFSSLYEKFMSKYTVKKPQYDEDFDSEALFDQIFGSKMDEE